MGLEQALKVHQGIWDGRGLDRPGTFLPCLRQGVSIDGRTHVKDKGLPWRRVDTNGQIQHNSTLTLVHPAIGFGSLYKVDTSA